MIIAVDFDGTLCGFNYPGIGAPHHDVIKSLKLLREYGHALILWTCRGGKALEEAVNWCEEHGIFFTAINQNLGQSIEKYGGDSKKIFADIYLDDKTPLGLSGVRAWLSEQLEIEARKLSS